MLEVKGDLWDRHDEGAWICITTNGMVRKDGALVMGRGCALEAKRRYPKFPYQLGDRVLTNGGNICHVFSELKIISFPVKHTWQDDASINLMCVSAQALMHLVKELKIDEIFLPRPGCGNGNLNWIDVKPYLEPLLSNQVKVITW